MPINEEVTRECNDCGHTEWREYEDLELTYPKRRQTSQQTTRRVLTCTNCGSDGFMFEDGKSGNVQFTKALR